MSLQLKQCPNGHFYDQSKHSECPSCTGDSANVNATMPVFGDSGIGVTVPAEQPAFLDRTMPGNYSPPRDEGFTQVLIKKELGNDPVVGWLVCVQGKEKGKDHRIHSEQNMIGRSDKMDITIHDDDTISRENHATLIFDPQDKTYYISQGQGRGIVRLNGKAVLGGAAQLQPYDKIDLGQSQFIFVPLCGEAFDWM